jgi:NAD-dependent SIR2 family protein deacetylase
MVRGVTFVLTGAGISAESGIPVLRAESSSFLL